MIDYCNLNGRHCKVFPTEAEFKYPLKGGGVGTLGTSVHSLSASNGRTVTCSLLLSNFLTGAFLIDYS